ncbi:MAG TPA: hypothetical protein VK425_11705 [Acidimicrobiales bacterium]|nr:hypothetical protein [Acidimicrobiales bacterium]
MAQAATALPTSQFSRREPAATTATTTGDMLIVLVVLAAGLGIWCLRRPDQLLHPYVWADEYHVLNRYQSQGAVLAALAPVKGYFIWPTSFTVAFGAWGDFLHLPEVEYWCATAWYLATLCLLLVPGSTLALRARALMALLLVLAPMNPEVFGVALYSFWWASLWPAITLTWSKDYWWSRTLALLVGGMSSLAGAAMVLPYAVRALMGKQRRDLISAGVLATAAAAQAGAYFTSARSQRTRLQLAPVAEQELRNFGYYPLSWLRHAPPVLLGALGVSVLVFVALCASRRAQVKNGRRLEVYVPLVIALVVVGVLCAVPAPLSTSPSSAGPRYYFLPFVLLSWVLVAVLCFGRDRWRRAVAAALVAGALAGVGANFSRHEPAVSWQAQLSRCRGAEGAFYVPVQFTGAPSQMWAHALIIRPSTCRGLGYPLR